MDTLIDSISGMDQQIALAPLLVPQLIMTTTMKQSLTIYAKDGAKP